MTYTHQISQSNLRKPSTELNLMTNKEEEKKHRNERDRETHRLSNTLSVTLNALLPKCLSAIYARKLQTLTNPNQKF